MQSSDTFDAGIRTHVLFSTSQLQVSGSDSYTRHKCFESNLDQTGVRTVTTKTAAWSWVGLNFLILKDCLPPLSFLASVFFVKINWVYCCSHGNMLGKLFKWNQNIMKNCQRITDEIKDRHSERMNLVTELGGWYTLNQSDSLASKLIWVGIIYSNLHIIIACPMSNKNKHSNDKFDLK